MAESKIDWSRFDPTKHRVDWKEISPNMKRKILYHHKRTYDVHWKEQNREKQRWYVKRSTTRNFIRHADKKELINVIKMARLQLHKNDN